MNIHAYATRAMIADNLAAHHRRLLAIDVIGWTAIAVALLGVAWLTLA